MKETTLKIINGHEIEITEDTIVLVETEKIIVSEDINFFELSEDELSELLDYHGYRVELPDDLCHVLFKTATQPNKWRKGMFYWNGKQPVFASYGSQITDVIKWKLAEEKTINSAPAATSEE